MFVRIATRGVRTGDILRRQASLSVAEDLHASDETVYLSRVLETVRMHV